MKIVFLDGFTMGKDDVDFGSVMMHGDLEIYDFSTFEEAKERICEAEIVIVNKFKVDQNVIESARKLKYIIVAATGYNNIDIGATLAAGIKVSNVRSYASLSVAQYVIATMLSVYNKTAYYINEVSQGRWQQNRDFCFYDHSIEELAGKKIGILGLGNIGKTLAKICHSFEMEIMAIDRNAVDHALPFIKFHPINTILNESDIVSLHLPLNQDTHHIINKATLDIMKKNSILINTGRGGLIDETALANHLNQHENFTACLDVLTIEPPRENSLIGLKNCLITPHLAWATRQARQRLIDGIALNIEAFKKGTLINELP